MQLTKERIRFFEEDQKKHGTQVALYNIIWEVAADILKGVGVKRVKTWNWQKHTKSK